MLLAGFNLSSLGAFGVPGFGLGDAASYSVAFTNLVEGSAQPGDTIGYTMDPVGGTVVTQKWGTTPGGAELGTATTAVPNNDGGTLYLEVTRDGEVVSRSVSVRYALGTDPVIGTQAWTIDDDAISIDGSASGTGLVFSGYTLQSAPSTASIHPTTGAISGAAPVWPGDLGGDTASVGCVDQYGRSYSDTFVWTTALRAQATAASGLGPFTFPEDSAITAENLAADFTDNGNLLTYAITGTALPASLVVSGAGSMDGTPNNITADASYTVRGTDEYGRTTDSTFNLEISASTVTTLTSVTVTDSGGGVGLIDVVASAPGVGVEIEVFGAIHNTGDPAPTNTEIQAGTGAEGTFSYTTDVGDPAVAAAIAGALDGLHHVYVTARITPAGPLSNVVSDLSVDFDTIAPVQSNFVATAGDAEIDVDGDTDTAEGTMRTIAVLNGAATPTPQQVLAGTDGSDIAAVSDSGNVTVTTSGAQPTETLTGVANGTAYDVYRAHKDASENHSLVASDLNVTPVAAPSFVFEVLGEVYVEHGGSAAVLDLGTKPMGAVTADRKIWIQMAGEFSFGNGPDPADLSDYLVTLDGTDPRDGPNGVSAAWIPMNAGNTSDRIGGQMFWVVNLPSGTTAQIQLRTQVGSESAFGDHIIRWGRVTGSPTFVYDNTEDQGWFDSVTPANIVKTLTQTPTTVDDVFILGFASQDRGDPGVDHAWTASQGTIGDSYKQRFNGISVATLAGLASTASTVITSTPSGQGNNYWAGGMGVRITP